MKNLLNSKVWSPYIVGAGIGVLSWFAFLTAEHPLGITTAFEHTMALIGQAVMPESAAQHGYYQSESPTIGWEWMLVVGVFVGGWISSHLSGDRELIYVPNLWRSRFGKSVGRRMTAAFLGGAVMMFGARMAGGCTSGHGISGTLQLAASSWLFTIILFVVGIATAMGVYGKEGRNHV